MIGGSFLFLGTGGSLGVPVIGCDCAVCHSPSAYNKRSRPSGLIRVNGKQLLIDAGPDFRTQAIKHSIALLDGVLLTHTHFDHIAGMDDLRVYSFQNKGRLPCLVSKETLDELKVRYHYLIHALDHDKAVSPKFDFTVLENDVGTVDFVGVTLSYVTYMQSKMKVTGFRLGSFAYISDIRHYSEEVIEALEGVKMLVLSALRHTVSEAHLTIDEAIFFARKVGATKTWLTHIAHDLDHDETNSRLPGDIQLAYDGLEVPLRV